MDEARRQEIAQDLLKRLEDEGHWGQNLAEMVWVLEPEISDDNLWKTLDEIRNQAHNEAHLVRHKNQNDPRLDPLKAIFDLATTARNEIPAPVGA